MRNKNGIFKVLQDDKVQSNFYKEIGKIFKEHNYTVFSCVIDKEKYKTKYPKENLAYEKALTYLCERTMTHVGKNCAENALIYCLEKRGNKKDRELKKLYTSIVRYGTEYKSTYDFKVCNPELFFRGKNQNINGLQFADLCAYPIARKILAPDIKQLTYELFENKIFSMYGRKKGFGIKNFP
jgi:hypothetical protein